MGKNEDEESEDGAPKSSFEVYRAEADMLYKIGQYKKAIASYTTALELRAEDKYCLVARAKCHLHLGSSAEALADAETSLKDEPDFPKGLFMKAEALYQIGKFEMALVFYHKGHNNRPELHEFKVGIQKSEEAINNSIGPGNCGKLKKVEGLDFLEDEDEEKKKKKAVGGGGYQRAGQKKDKNALREKPESVSGDKAVKTLLGDLYADREFLDMLLQEEDKRPGKMNAPRIEVRNLCIDGINYLDNRTDFWRQQKPTANRNAKSSKRGAADDQKLQRGAVMRKLEMVQEAEEEGDWAKVAKLCEKTIPQLEAATDKEIENRVEMLAALYDAAGESHYQREELSQSLEMWTKERDLGGASENAEVSARGASQMGRAHMRLGEHKDAIDLWEGRLPEAGDALEKAWLNHDIGRCYLEMAQFAKASEYGSAALEAAEAGDDKYWKMNAYVLMAQANAKQREYEAGILAYEKCLELAGGDNRAEEAIQKAVNNLKTRHQAMLDGNDDTESEKEKTFVDDEPTDQTFVEAMSPEPADDAKKADKAKADQPKKAATPTPTPRKSATPAAEEAKSKGEFIMYEITVHTADITNSGTDAKVFVVFTGPDPALPDKIVSSGTCWLQGKFEQDDTDVTEIEAPDMSLVTSVKIGHDDGGFASGWYLDKVTVYNPTTRIEQHFPCDQWLATDEGDGLIERDLTENETLRVTRPDEIVPAASAGSQKEV